MQSKDVAKLRSKLWGGDLVTADDWNSPDVARWMGSWNSWGDSSIRALQSLPHVKDLLQRARQSRVLDFGCGPGLLVGHLQPLCKHVVGLDVAQAMIDQLNAKRQAAGWQNVGAVALDITDGKDAEELARVPGGPFDLVVSVTVLGFIARRKDDDVAALRALRTVMAPAGLFVHMDWPGASCSDVAGARELYAAAGLEFVHFGHASIGGAGVCVGIARQAG